MSHLLLVLGQMAAAATPTAAPSSTAVLISPAGFQAESNLIALGAALLVLVIWVGVLLNSRINRSDH